MDVSFEELDIPAQLNKNIKDFLIDNNIKFRENDQLHTLYLNQWMVTEGIEDKRT
jgi:hypothetical protein